MRPKIMVFYHVLSSESVPTGCANPDITALRCTDEIPECIALQSRNDLLFDNGILVVERTGFLQIARSYLHNTCPQKIVIFQRKDDVCRCKLKLYVTEVKSASWTLHRRQYPFFCQIQHDLGQKMFGDLEFRRQLFHFEELACFMVANHVGRRFEAVFARFRKHVQK